MENRSVTQNQIAIVFLWKRNASKIREFLLWENDQLLM